MWCPKTPKLSNNLREFEALEKYLLRKGRGWTSPGLLFHNYYFQVESLNVGCKQLPDYTQNDVCSKKVLLIIESFDLNNATILQSTDLFLICGTKHR